MIATRAREAASNAAFSPLSVAGLKLWLKADVITGKNDGDAIAQWDDQSGQGNHLVQATGARQPLYKTNQVNSKPTVRFDGVNDYLRVAFTLAQPETVFLCYKSIVVGGNGAHDIIYDGVAGDDGALIVASLPQTQLYAGGSKAIAQSIADGVFVVTTAFFSGATSTLRLNGTALALGAGSAGTSSPSGFTLGGKGGGTSDRWTNIDVAEGLIYSTTPSAGERASIESYLGTKYGIGVV